MSKVKRSLVLADLYRSYKIRCKEKGITPKSYAAYRSRIVKMGEVMSEILLERGIVGLPWMNGDIFMKEFKPINGVVDKRKSAELKTRVLHFNDHSDGILYIPFWLSPERRDKKRRQWCFSIFRGTKRELGRLLKNKNVRYPDFKQLNNRANK